MEPEEDGTASAARAAIDANVKQQIRTRRRRGSLRKVALLGRGAQRERRDVKHETAEAALIADLTTESSTKTHIFSRADKNFPQHDALGLEVGTPSSFRGKLSLSGLNSTDVALDPLIVDSENMPSERGAEQSYPYNSTTDEDDVLHIARGPTASRTAIGVSSGSDSYFPGMTPLQPRRPSNQQAKSPLSYSGLSTANLPSAAAELDYAETEWWGWVVLCVTWFVFVVGMGSCLDVWSWAWDVGKTPYAPPELENDPTLPIVGYYPSLIILTAVMAWVWVVVAWVGMKYFRHSKISGD